MIKAERQPDGSHKVSMDNADWIAICRLAKAYGITPKAMLVGCINKGIEIVGKQVSTNESKGRPWCHG